MADGILWASIRQYPPKFGGGAKSFSYKDLCLFRRFTIENTLCFGGQQTVIGANAARFPSEDEPRTPCLAMRPREAAKALGISERLLWQWTHKGIVPHIRQGKVTLYPVDTLREWLRKRSETSFGSDG